MTRNRSILAEFTPEMFSWDVDLQEVDNLFVLHSEHGGPIERTSRKNSGRMQILQHDTPEHVQDKQLAYLSERTTDRIIDCRKVTRTLMRKHTEGIIHIPDLLESKLDVHERTRTALLRLTSTIPLLAYMQDNFQFEYQVLLEEAYAADRTEQPSLYDLAAKFTTTWISETGEREIQRFLNTYQPRSVPARKLLKRK